MRALNVVYLTICMVGIFLLAPSSLRAADQTSWILESGQVVYFRGLVSVTYSGPGVYRTDMRLQVVLPEESGEPDHIAIADSLFEEVLGPVVTMMGTRRALVSFGTVESGFGEDWSSRGPNMTYLRRGRAEHMSDAEWRRSSHTRVSVGESTVSHLEVPVPLTLSNGVAIIAHPYARSLNPQTSDEFLNVRYEAPLSEQDGRAAVDNSLLYWRTIIEPAVADTDVQVVQIIAHEEGRSERFQFRCGSVVQMRRQKDGSWTESLGAPLIFQLGDLGLMFTGTGNTSDRGNTVNGCSF